jgi:hypothetical protein
MIYIVSKTRRQRRIETLKTLAYYTINPLWMLVVLWALLVFGLSV